MSTYFIYTFRFRHRRPQVRAIKFDPGYLDESVLWAESEDLADGFRRIHMVNNMDYIFDAEEAIPQYGGARDGTRLILFRWNASKKQLWQIAPSTPDHALPVRIACQSDQKLSLLVRDGTAILARSDHMDVTQVSRFSFRRSRPEAIRPLARPLSPLFLLVSSCRLGYGVTGILGM